MKNFKLLVIGLLLSAGVAAQVGIGTTTPNTSAALDITSTTSGLLVPRMTHAQLIAIALPATGLLVFQADGTAGFYFNSGTPGTPVWTFIQNSANANVTLQGNSFNSASQLVQLNASSQLPAVSGVNLTNLNATNLASGTVGTGLLGSGTPSATTFLRGDGTWSVPLTLTTTGTSGAATFLSGVLNIPTPAATGGVNYGTIGTLITTNTTVTGSATVYLISDGVTITLPLASTTGQVLILLNLTTTSNGFTIQRQGTNTIMDALTGALNITSEGGFIFQLV